MRRVVVCLLTLFCLTFGNGALAESIAPGKTGAELVEFLRTHYRPATTLSYRGAREKMFAELDNVAGKVRCVYTGVEITTAGIPDGNVMNTEHSWPQSKFHEHLPMRSDLHHLFPTLTKVNSIRGNHPFGEIPDEQTTGWWLSNSKQNDMPPIAQRDAYSESTSSTFEPREDHKGNVARAMLYFLAVYGGDNVTPDWLTPQLPTLLQWHVKDPIDQTERDRNARIRAVQGNENPFIIDPTLPSRMLSATAPASPVVAVESPAPGSTTAPAFFNRSGVDSGSVRIATWNAKELFTIQDVANRQQDLQEFAEEIQPDILLVQEVTSLKVVQAMREAMGLTDYSVACSDFNQDDTQQHASFEVGIISRYPLDQVIEYDPSPDNVEEGDPDEAPLATPLLRFGMKPQPTFRGYLWARIDAIKTTVSVVHLKSSRGKSGPADETNAKEREFVIAAVAAGVNEDRNMLPGYSNVVGGDFNVGNRDESKLGKDLTEDCFKKDCNGADRYDETHSLLSAGLVGRLKMKNVALAISEATFVGGFSDTGPIDNIYVDGRSRERFADAQRASAPFGSDHYGVWTEIRVTRPLARAARTTSGAAPGALRAGDHLKICSFNIQFLGSFKKRDNPGLASILKDYDLVVIEELVAPPIDGAYPDGEAFEADPESQAFFAEMETLGFDYRLSDEDTGSGEEIHNPGPATEWWVVFYKPERVELASDLPSGFLADDRSNNSDFERVPYAFPFRSKVGKTDFVLIPVHLMPGSSESERRKHELTAIASWINTHDDTEKDFIILGDMNIENAAELADVKPMGFVSLNDECRQTNTNVKGPKPYDHVLFQPAVSTEIDQTFDFQVVNLVDAMRSHWTGTTAYPGDPPYNHNEFRQHYSDHNPVVFQITLTSTDDD